MTVICASLIYIQRDFGVGTRIEIFWISMRHLADCHSIMAVICMIRRIWSGTILMH